MIGDGFLIYDGDVDQFENGVYYLAPRDSFEKAALLRFNTKPVRGDLFFLKADRDQDKAELWGVNIEYHKESLGTLAAIYFHVLWIPSLFFGEHVTAWTYSVFRPTKYRCPAFLIYPFGLNMFERPAVGVTERLMPMPGMWNNSGSKLLLGDS